jgi:aspartyl-tRNA(Asn)/glutamyl-tRNA(Gln) amidotransferase subunit C
MSISRSEVEHVARLCRLAFEKEELEKFTQELGKILDYVEKLKELDTAEVEPSLHGLEGEPHVREDEGGGEMLSKEDALKGAPDKEKGHFRIPGTL